MSKPLAIDLFCGLGGWTDGLLAEGWDVIGFDIERHAYGDHRYPARLVLQDVRTINGAQFKDASLIVASSPCQEFSYRAMPWKRAKALGPPELGMELFAQAERIQREAIAAAGRFIPMVQENVRGAQKYVGRARWHYGSFYLWGDVPALMPITLGKGAVKVATMGAGWYHPSDPRHVPALGFNTHADRAMRAEMGIKAGDRNTARAEGGHRWTTGFDVHVADDLTIPRAVKLGKLTPEQGKTARSILFGDDSVKVASEEGRRTDIGKGARFTSRDCGDESIKNAGGSWFGIGSPGQKVTNQNPVNDAVKQGGDWFNAEALDRDGQQAIARRSGSSSQARKAASARIAKIPIILARHIARTYFPTVGSGSPADDASPISSTICVRS